MSGSIPMWTIVLDPSGAVTTGEFTLEGVIDQARQLTAGGHHVVKVTDGRRVIEGEELKQLLRGFEPPAFENFPR